LNIRQSNRVDRWSERVIKIRRTLNRPPASRPSKEEVDHFFQYYAAARAYVMSESTLIGNRVTWIITINGFLFASAGLIFQQWVEHPEFKVDAIRLFLVVCIVALLINILGWLTIHAAQQAGEAVEKIFETPGGRNYWVEPAPNNKSATIVHGPGGYRMPGIRGGGEKRNVRNGHLASFCIPWVFAAGWTAFIICGLGGEPAPPVKAGPGGEGLSIFVTIQSPSLQPAPSSRRASGGDRGLR
jgi:hypothetical protein